VLQVPVDKVRFCDPDAVSSPSLVHTVEVSDGRSLSHFLTFWVKGGRDQGNPAKAWADKHGLDGHHNREVYHREPDPWLPQQFPGMDSKGWSKHYHADLKNPPTWADVEPFCDELPACLRVEIKDYFDGRPAGKHD
jgi:hypothetical protein